MSVRRTEYRPRSRKPSFVGQRGPARRSRSYREAASLARRLHDATRLAWTAIGVHDLGWRQSHATSIDLLDEAAYALPETASTLRARVLASLARDLHHSVREQNWERAAVLAEEAVGIARELADPDTLGFCLLALHDVQWRPGTADSRFAGDRRDARCRRCRPGPRHRGPSSTVARHRTHRARRPPRHRRARVLLPDLRRTGHARARYNALSRRATSALLAGRLAEAQDLAEQAFALGENIGEADAGGSTRPSCGQSCASAAPGTPGEPSVSTPTPGRGCRAHAVVQQGVGMLLERERWASSLYASSLVSSTTTLRWTRGNELGASGDEPHPAGALTGCRRIVDLPRCDGVVGGSGGRASPAGLLRILYQGVAPNAQRGTN